MSDTERKRASLFGDDGDADAPPPAKKLNLDRFAPKKAPSIDPKLAEDLSEQAGFTTKHAPKKSAKPPAKRDGRRLKKSTRTAQFNIRLKPENADRFWAGAESEGMEYADDFLEHLLNLYEGRGS